MDAPGSKGRVVIVGANGRLGKKMLLALTAAGYDAVGVARSPVEHAEGLPFTQADALDFEALADALAGADVVVDNVSGYKPGGFPRKHAKIIASRAHVNIVTAARQARVRQAVVVSVLAADLADASVPHFAEKSAAEEAHRGSGIPTLALRPGVFVDQADGRIERGLEKGVFEAVGDKKAPFGWVYTDTVCKALVRGIDEQATGVHDVVDSIGSPALFAEWASERLGRPVKAKVHPMWVFELLTFFPRMASPGLRNLHGMLKFFSAGKFVPRRA